MMRRLRSRYQRWRHQMRYRPGPLAPTYECSCGEWWSGLFGADLTLYEAEHHVAVFGGRWVGWRP